MILKAILCVQHYWSFGAILFIVNLLKLCRCILWKCRRQKFGSFSIFVMMLKEILCVQHFCSFGAMLFIVNLLIKTDSTVVCLPCTLEHVCYEPFSLKKLLIWKISYVNWLDFVYCLKFTSLRPCSSK